MNARISGLVSSAYTWSPRKSTRSGHGSPGSSDPPSVIPARNNAYA